MHEGRNTVIWVMLWVPLLSIVGGAVTLWLSYEGVDPELPAHYHWEGRDVERDFMLAAEARALDVRAAIDFAADGRVTMEVLAADPEALPGEVTLRITHATLPSLDRELRLVRTGSGYGSIAAPLGRGTWLVELRATDRWLLRGKVSGPTQVLRLAARTPT
jgi:hypothetical protein